jgi:hypothetical protein
MQDCFLNAITADRIGQDATSLPNGFSHVRSEIKVNGTSYIAVPSLTPLTLTKIASSMMMTISARRKFPQLSHFYGTSFRSFYLHYQASY